MRFCIKNSCIACVFVSKHTCVAISCNLPNRLTETASVQTLKENIAKTPKFTKDAHGSAFLCQNTLFATKNSLCLRLFFCDLQLPCIICLTVFVIFFRAVGLLFYTPVYFKQTVCCLLPSCFFEKVVQQPCKNQISSGAIANKLTDTLFDVFL